MRMDRSQGPTAADVVNRTAARRSWPTSSTATARSARRAASRAPSCARASGATSRPPASWRRSCARAAGRARRPGLDPATLTFQALRIHVNRELEGLGDALAVAGRAARARRAPGGDRVPQPGGPRGQAGVPRRWPSEGFTLLTKKPLRPARRRGAPQPALAQRAPARRSSARRPREVARGRARERHPARPRHRQLAGGARGRPAHVARHLAAPAAGGGARGRARALRLAEPRAARGRRGSRSRCRASASACRRRTASSAWRRRRSRACAAWRRSPCATWASCRRRPSRCWWWSARCRAAARRAARARQGRRRGGPAVSARTPLAPLAPRRRPGERLVRLRLMLMALSICLWARRDRASAWCSCRCWSARPSRARPRARASAPSTSTRAAAPSSTATATTSRVSVDAESIYAVPQEIEDARARRGRCSRAPSASTPRRRKDLQAQLQKNRAFVWVKRKVDPRHARAVRDLQLHGIGFLTENRRYYPKRELASQVLGYVGLDNTGHERHRVRLRGADPRQGGQGHRAHRRAPPPGRPHREAVHRRRTPSCSPSTRPSSTWRRRSWSAPCRRRARSPASRW